MAYTAYITTLQDVHKDPNSDKLYTARALNEGVIVGGGAATGDRVIYFPADGCLCDYDFMIAFNLLRKDRDGNDAGGYLDANAHIKALKLRGLRSEGIVISLDKFAAFYKLTAADFKDGEAIDKVGDTLICKKYIPKNTKIANSTGKSSMRGKKKGNIVLPEFALHSDTGHLAYSQQAFAEGDLINISLKMHGTSQRSMNTYAEYPKGFFRRLFRIKPKTKQIFALGTRRTVLMGSLENSGFYGNDSFRVKHHEKLKPHLTPGLEVFYEVVGFVSEGKPIMPSGNNKKVGKEFEKRYGLRTDFTYGCENGESEMYVYRITDNGREFTPMEIIEWCRKADVNHVPFFEEFYFTSWENLLTRVEKWIDGDDPVGKTHLREGVVVRIVNRVGFKALKAKSLNFKILEGLVKESASAPDMEEAEEGEDAN